MKRMAWIVLGWLMLGCAAQAASFDCEKATSAIEKLICDNNELSWLDEMLGHIYRTALERSTGKRQISKEQRLWLKNVRNVCQNVECVKDAYKQRIDSIDLVQEVFMHVECIAESGKLLIDNNLSTDMLPLASHSGKLSIDDRVALKKLGYYSVAKTWDKQSCKLGAETYSFFISYHESRERGECAAAEFWSLWFVTPAGQQFAYTLDGDVCFPGQPLLKSIRLELVPHGQTLNVCASDDSDAPVVCKTISN